MGTDYAVDWIRTHVTPSGEIDTIHVRPWSRLSRVPTANGDAWFKKCGPVQAFEPALTAALYARRPTVAPEVIAHDDERAWMLLADAGTPIGVHGNPPEAWLTVLPAYAELQRSEADHVAEHLARGVPDLRIATLPARFDVDRGQRPRVALRSTASYSASPSR